MEATLKDFEQFPGGLVVEFPQLLLPGLYCDLCRNISPVLFIDPDRHWFCTTCMAMATTEDVFECPCDNKEFSVQKLMRDDTVTAKLRKAHVICPSSRESCPVDIPFSALKAHMAGCSCKEVAPCPCSKKDRETTRCSMANEKKEWTTPTIARDVPVPHAQNPSSGEDRKEKSEASAVPPLIQHQRESQETTSKVGARTVHLGGSSPDREILQNSTPNKQTRFTNCPYCKQLCERHELQNHIRRCSSRRSPRQDNFTFQSLSSSPENNGRSASVVNTKPKLERSGRQNGGNPQAEKEQILKKITHLICQLTEKLGSANCQCAEQVKALQVLEEVEALCRTLRAMQI